MRELDHDPMVKVGEARKVTKLRKCLQGQIVIDELNLGWFQMHTTLIHDVPQILD
jgi:hypothetical protein